MSPLRNRPIAISVTCIFVLMASIPNHSGLEWWAFGIGLFYAFVFWMQCFVLEHSAAE